MHRIIGRRSFVLFLMMFFFISFVEMGFSQSDGNKLNGIVLNGENPISNVHIMVKQNGIGLTSDRFGMFELHIGKLPFDITISHIGYETQTLHMSDSLWTANGGFYKIQLQKKIQTLSEVEILENKLKIIDKSEHQWKIIDYHLVQDYIVVLKSSYAKRKLKMMSMDGHRSFEMPLQMKVDHFEIDGLGNSYLANNEEIWQFFILPDSIYFYQKIDVKIFQAKIACCEGRVAEGLLYKSLDHHNQKICYSIINPKSQQIIHEIYSKERYSFAQGCIDERTQLVRQYGYINDMGELSSGDMKVKRRLDLLKWTYDKIGRIPYYSPVFVLNDTIIIFDHEKSSICFYNGQGELINGLDITYHQHKNWDNKIYLDDKKNEFYIRFRQNGKTALYQLDMKTGVIHYAYTITQSPFPEKIIIENNSLFFMFVNNGQSRVLFESVINDVY